MYKIILSVSILISALLTVSNCQDCPSDNNDCTTESFIYGGCYSIYNQFIDCESTASYKACVSKCKLSPQYSKCGSVSCDYETMTCKFGSTTCDDNNKCTSEYCNSATGCVSSATNCTDGLSSTNDNCMPIFGCYYTINQAQNNIKTCSSNADCNDNLPCTTDVCVNNRCNSTINCDSNSLCGKNGYCTLIPTPTN
ncbi:hypothetical protein RB653_009807 [Dictyostelium firmibasis]|uniref:Uncharacterized protein n=1 Tax=Dictyostelium firmibasis TaxID=79012 RepID=A0AAN7TJU2_9MYCE